MELICCQIDIAWEDRAANIVRIRSLLNGVPIAPGSLLVFPELSTSGFTMNVGAATEPDDGESSAFFSGLAQTHSCHIIAGIAGQDPSGRGRNEAVSFSPTGEVSHRYRKMRPFPLLHEGDFYPAGSDIAVLPLGGWKAAPFICYDLRFPELFRKATAQGAELLVVIANWPAARIDHWTTLLRARAIENQAYVAGVNRCGSDPNFEYPGASLIVGPTGEVLATAGSHQEIIRAPLERSTLDDWRTRFPALADLKPL